jgi:hypothetical protein
VVEQDVPFVELHRCALDVNSQQLAQAMRAFPLAVAGLTVASLSPAVGYRFYAGGGCYRYRWVETRFGLVNVCGYY